MSAADVETQSQQETSNGTSKFDVPEIELIIKVGYTALHYTTPNANIQTLAHTQVCINLWCVCVFDFFMRASQIFFVLHNKVKMLLHILRTTTERTTTITTLSSSFLTFCLPLLLLCHMKSKTYSHYVHFLFFLLYFFSYYFYFYLFIIIFVRGPPPFVLGIFAQSVCLFFSLLRLPLPLLLLFFFSKLSIAKLVFASLVF